MLRTWLPLLAISFLAAGCYEATSPIDPPPAAPRGLYSVTGDEQVTLHWLANTESDVAGYHVYEGPCASGSSCPYDLVGTVTRANATTFVVTGLANGETRYFAVAAFDRYGNESDLTYEDIFDTPRPAGTGAALQNADTATDQVAFDFSAYGTPGVYRDWNDPRSDMYYTNGGVALMVVPSLSTGGIQDMGSASSLDAVDFAPTSGWSPTGSVELIPGHNYVVWTRVDPTSLHYAKFRVTAVTPDVVVFDWAYQVDASNRELKVRPAGKGV